MKILGLCDISKVCCFITWLPVILVDFISENVIFDRFCSLAQKHVLVQCV